MLKRELKINLKSLIIWTLIISGMLIMVFAIYPYIDLEGNLSKIDEMIKMFPQEVLKAFNMDTFSISTVFGWIKTEGYVFIILLGSIYSSLLGSSILSIEEREKTIEFLAVKPIKRNNIVTSKILAALIEILIFNTIIFIVQLIGLTLSNELDFILLLKMNISPLLLYGMMFSISLLISTIIKNQKKSTAIGLIVAFIPYMAQLIGTISTKVDILRKTSLYEFISLKYLIDNNHINFIYLIIGLIIIIISLITTYKIYNKKELV